MSIDDDIILKNVDEPEDKKLPIGIYVIIFGDQFVFARRIAGRFIPVSKKEQEEIIKLIS